MELNNVIASVFKVILLRPSYISCSHIFLFGRHKIYLIIELRRKIHLLIEFETYNFLDNRIEIVLLTSLRKWSIREEYAFHCYFSVFRILSCNHILSCNVTPLGSRPVLKQEYVIKCLCIKKYHDLMKNSWSGTSCQFL